jgi:hypothetical protein
MAVGNNPHGRPSLAGLERSGNGVPANHQLRLIRLRLVPGQKAQHLSRPRKEPSHTAYYSTLLLARCNRDRRMQEQEKNGLANAHPLGMYT